MINWNALHAACVERITIYKENAYTSKRFMSTMVLGKYLRLTRRYETLLEFIDTRIQTSINQPIYDNHNAIQP